MRGVETVHKAQKKRRDLTFTERALTKRQAAHAKEAAQAGLGSLALHSGGASSHNVNFRDLPYSVILSVRGGPSHLNAQTYC